MTAFNIVRMVVKPGKEQAYLDLHKARDITGYGGMKSFNVVKTGEREYVLVGKWDSMEAIVAARPEMIRTLDSFRDLLEDLGGDLGATDPRSGEAVLTMKRAHAPA